MRAAARGSLPPPPRRNSRLGGTAAVADKGTWLRGMRARSQTCTSDGDGSPAGSPAARRQQSRPTTWHCGAEDAEDTWLRDMRARARTYSRASGGPAGSGGAQSPATGTLPRRRLPVPAHPELRLCEYVSDRLAQDGQPQTCRHIVTDSDCVTCLLHTCGHPGCCRQKPSRSRFCVEHRGRARARAPATAATQPRAPATSCPGCTPGQHVCAACMHACQHTKAKSATRCFNPGGQREKQRDLNRTLVTESQRSNTPPTPTTLPMPPTAAPVVAAPETNPFECAAPAGWNPFAAAPDAAAPDPPAAAAAVLHDGTGTYDNVANVAAGNTPVLLASPSHRSSVFESFDLGSMRRAQYEQQQEEEALLTAERQAEAERAAEMLAAERGARLKAEQAAAEAQQQAEVERLARASVAEQAERERAAREQAERNAAAANARLTEDQANRRKEVDADNEHKAKLKRLHALFPLMELDAIDAVLGMMGDDFDGTVQMLKENYSQLEAMERGKKDAQMAAEMEQERIREEENVVKLRNYQEQRDSIVAGRRWPFWSPA